MNMTEQNTIPKGWKKTTLGEVAEPSKQQWKPGDHDQRYLGLEHIEPNQLTISGYGSSSELASNKFYFDIGDTLFGKLRPYFRKVWKAKFKGVCSTDIWVLKPRNDFDKDFLFYFVANPYFVNKSMGANIGTHMPRADWHFLESTEWAVPPLSEQHAIAAVLSSFDDKIELLREQNKTLEATAQAIFKEWFVNFNFPNAQGRPYKASGGKMIDSEFGEIPKGWRVGRLGDEVETVLGGTPSTEKKEYWENGNIPWINSGKVNDFRIYEPTAYITEKALNDSATKLMPKGTVVIAITGATLGQVSRLEIESTGNQSVIGIIPNDKFSSAYLFYWMLESVSKIINTATGGAQQHINKNDVNNFDFILPSDDVLRKHWELVGPLVEKISSNCFQIQTLSTLRDILLPKLMKGEVRVKGFVK